MFLKRITIAGFKSFCDRVDFEFGPGVTGIVGPNGCGKSNVVDAFKWVLGEQSARSLRGRQMIDMIFNGSSSRRASSIAQVDIVFDNQDRSLPTDFEEVTVSRKLYRSGESEYLLNQQAARLKDIRELFMDTGVGVDSYSVIEQGRVDGLLQSNPVERRIIFDEAAGISKYKARRRETERKLERTEQNLLRVADIVEEIEKRLRSVKLQAGKARNYQQYDARLGELRSAYAMAEYHRFSCDIDSLTCKTDEATDGVTKLRTDIDRHEMESARATGRLDAIAESLGASENDLVQDKSSLSAAQARLESSDRRSEELREQLDRAQSRLGEDASRIETSRCDIQQVDQVVNELKSQEERFRKELETVETSDHELGRNLTQAQAILEDEKSGIIELVRRSAAAHNEITRLNTHRESLVGQKGRLSERDAKISVDLEENLQQKAQFEHQLHDLDALISSQTEKLEEKKLAATQTALRQRELNDQLTAAKEKRSALQSRQELLDDLEQKMEGVAAGARKLLDEKRLCEGEADGLPWVVGLVADIFSTDVTHAKIIESALGELDQNVVVTDSDNFLTHFDENTQPPGRLTASCLDRLPPVMNERDFSENEGFVARAVDLVHYDECYSQLAHHLLGKTVVADTLENAIQLANEDVSEHRFVTLNGEVVEPDGRISVGPSSSTAGLISRKSELHDIEIQLAIVEENVNELAETLNQSRAKLNHLEGVQQELRTAIYESSTAKIEANAAMKKITEAVSRLTSERPIIAQEAMLIESQISEVHLESERGGKSLEAIDRENNEKEGRIAKHRDHIEEIAAARNLTQEQLTELRVSVGQLAEKRTAAMERRSALHRNLAELEQLSQAVHRDIERLETQIQEERESKDLGREQIEALTARIDELENQVATLRNTRDSIRLELDEHAQAVKTARSQLTESEEQLHAMQMSLAEIKVRRDELLSRVQEEMGVDLAERYPEYEHAEQDWNEVETEIAELREKMNRLGNVNLDAINELEELEERHGFLTNQRDDLSESRNQLEQLIEKLNLESRDRFKIAFEQIRDHFRSMFRKLFGGGRADIVLENPDEILESGIEIVAQPPGKELQVISLMSGGEKSLTAIALLMSIFQSKPAPFAIMDEVDAALDEANNDRFNRIIREFVTQSQFIVITHSKWTMNIADRLYGVTMQEPGVSTRVSVKLGGANVA